MHSQNIVHRDIKPENVLLIKPWVEEDDYPKVKLIDFGAARYFKMGCGQRMRTVCGTVDYLSPQHVLGKGYDEKCDVWSCGVLAYQMLSGDMPFFAATNGEVKRKIREGKLSFPDAEWEEISLKAKDCIKSMLAYNDKERPSANVVLQTEWITDFAPTLDKALPWNLYDRIKGFQSFSKLKRLALTVIAQQLFAHDDFEILTQAFQSLDKCSNGFIPLDKMASVLKAEKTKLGELSLSSEDEVQIEDLVRSCNTSGNQNIDITEFLAATMDKPSYARADVLWFAFRVFDGDHDGKISKKDLAGLLGETSETSPIVKAIFEEVVATSKGGEECELDFDMFRRVLETDAGLPTFTVASEPLPTLLKLPTPTRRSTKDTYAFFGQ